MNRILGAAILAVSLYPLNKGKGKNSNQFPALKTRRRTPQTWWNSLTEDSKVGVGCAAMHFHLMSANYKWRCQDRENNGGGSQFVDLTKSQQNIIKTVFERRNRPYSVVDIQGVKMNIIQ